MNSIENYDLTLYVTYDRIAGRYMPPFAMPNDQTAIRSFRYAMKNLKEQAPEDLELYKIADYDSNTSAMRVYEKEFVYRGVTENE